MGSQTDEGGKLGKGHNWEDAGINKQGKRGKSNALSEQRARSKAILASANLGSWQGKLSRAETCLWHGGVKRWLVLGELNSPRLWELTSPNP